MGSGGVQLSYGRGVGGSYGRGVGGSYGRASGHSGEGDASTRAEMGGTYAPISGYSSSSGKPIICARIASRCL